MLWQQSVWLALYIVLQMFLLPDSIAAETTDCGKLPKPIRPHECCRYPELFKQNLIDFCVHLKSNGNDQCFYECVFDASEICRKGKFDFRKARDYVDWVMRPENEFTQIYKNAYKKCIEKVEQDIQIKAVAKKKRRTACNPFPELVYLCVQNEMFTSCPANHWNMDILDCADKRDFISNCLRSD